ncbi:hypothetical protein A2U01_0078711, partial [Trifolium medium]|nr:hypothetical protein [Trifolium medium]
IRIAIAMGGWELCWCCKEGGDGIGGHCVGKSSRIKRSFVLD